MPGVKYFASSFCKKCGSSLPWPTQSRTAQIVPAGILDEDPKTRPIHNIYYSDEACWNEDFNGLVKYDELPTKK